MLGRKSKKSASSDDKSYLMLKAPNRKVFILKGLAIFLGIVLVVGLVYEGIILSHTKHKPSNQNNLVASKSLNSNSVQYKANGNDLNLSFYYPSSWSVNPATSTDSNDQPISVTSPLIQVYAADGSSHIGKAI